MAILDRFTRHPDDDIEVIVLSSDEWDRAVRRSLKKLNLTYDELAEQARTGDFSSWRARKLWLTIGSRQRGST
jgi:hypothetical protein